MKHFFLALIIVSLGIAEPAHAYIGLGLGLSALGSIATVVLTVLLTLVGLLWLPIKSYRDKKKDKQDEDE